RKARGEHQGFRRCCSKGETFRHQGHLCATHRHHLDDGARGEGRAVLCAGKLILDGPEPGVAETEGGNLGISVSYPLVKPSERSYLPLTSHTSLRSPAG